MKSSQFLLVQAYCRPFYGPLYPPPGLVFSLHNIGGGEDGLGSLAFYAECNVSEDCTCSWRQPDTGNLWQCEPKACRYGPIEQASQRSSSVVGT